MILINNRAKRILRDNKITRQVRDEVYKLAKEKDALNSNLVDFSLRVYVRYNNINNNNYYY